MRFGFHLSTEGGLFRAIDQALERGSEALQIFAGSPRRWSRPPLDLEEARRFREEVTRLCLRPLVVHSSYLVNLASPDGEVRRRSIREVVEDLRRAQLVGADFVVVHMGHHKGAGEEKGLRLLLLSLGEVLERAPSNGPLLLLENSAGAGTDLGYLPDHWGRVLGSLPEERVGLCLDIAHAHQAFCALNQPTGPEGLVEEVKRSVGLSRLKLLHLSDSRSPPLSKVDRHEHLGEGTVGREGLWRLINHRVLRGFTAILETPTMELSLDLRNLKFAKSLIQYPSFPAMGEERNLGGVFSEPGRLAKSGVEELANFEKEIAEEHFSLAQVASSSVRPLLTFYGLFHLVKATYLSLAQKPFKERVHGLTCRLPKGEEPSSLSQVKVGVKSKGAFRFFESLYDPHPIPEGVSFTLDELIEGKGHAAKIPSLSRHYLALFGLSHIARYEPALWRGALKGEDPASAALLSYLEKVAEECRREVALVAKGGKEP